MNNEMPHDRVNCCIINNNNNCNINNNNSTLNDTTFGLLQHPTPFVRGFLPLTCGSGSVCLVEGSCGSGSVCLVEGSCGSGSVGHHGRLIRNE